MKFFVFSLFTLAMAHLHAGDTTQQSSLSAEIQRIREQQNRYRRCGVQCDQVWCGPCHYAPWNEARYLAPSQYQDRIAAARARSMSCTALAMAGGTAGSLIWLAAGLCYVSTPCEQAVCLTGPFCCLLIPICATFQREWLIKRELLTIEKEETTAGEHQQLLATAPVEQSMAPLK